MSDLRYAIFFLFALFFLIEQIFYWFLGSYPYRYGFVINTIKIPNIDTNLDSLKNKITGANNKACIKNGKLYIRYKYPFSVFGPLLFVGQIESVERTAIFQIKVGPASAVFVFFLAGSSIMSMLFTFLSPEVFTNSLINVLKIFINIFCIIVLIAYFYFRFVNPVKNILKEKGE